MASMENKSGFVTDGYIDKKGTSPGDPADLNEMPPGMNIEDQEMSDIRDMPLKKIVPLSYPGDGGF